MVILELECTRNIEKLCGQIPNIKQRPHVGINILFNSACPIMSSSDFGKSKAFYKRLGFEVAHDYPEQGYLILTRDDVEIHFFEYAEHVAEESDHGVYIRVEDANALSSEYQNLNLPKEGLPRFVEAEDKPWGLCELVILDTDGNLLRIDHILED